MVFIVLSFLKLIVECLVVKSDPVACLVLLRDLSKIGLSSIDLESFLPLPQDVLIFLRSSSLSLSLTFWNSYPPRSENLETNNK